MSDVGKKNTADLLSDIRANYVGTADEHDLLSRLQADFQGEFEQVATSLESEFAERLRSLTERESRCALIEESARIDSAVYEYIRCARVGGEDPDPYYLGELARAMLARGLRVSNVEKLLPVLAELDADSEVDAECRLDRQTR